MLELVQRYTSWSSFLVNCEDLTECGQSLSQRLEREGNNITIHAVYSLQCMLTFSSAVHASASNFCHSIASEKLPILSETDNSVVPHTMYVYKHNILR